MSLRSVEKDAHAYHWSLRLLSCLGEMAAGETNAALLALGNAGSVVDGSRYPEEGLLFANRRWRAFYHCHADEAAHPDEHGHFHIFTDVGDRQWAHVAALAIDSYGQPLHWFTVNRWVTGGAWFETARFSALASGAFDDDKEALAGRWLYAMLMLYQADLLDLLNRRDARIRECCGSAGSESTFDRRDIHLLSKCDVDLETKLGMHVCVQSRCS